MDHDIQFVFPDPYDFIITLNLADVTGVSLSPDDGNQLVVVHIKNNSDLVLSLKSRKNEDLTGELIGVLTAHFDKAFGRSLSVRVSNELEATTGQGSGKRHGRTGSWNGGEFILMF